MKLFFTTAVLLCAMFFSGGTAKAEQAAIDWQTPVASTVASPASAPAYSGNAFERYFIEQPFPKKVTLYDGRDYQSNVTPSGAFRGNASRGDTFYVEGQRNAYWLISAAILATGSEKNDLLDKGLKALEWTFDRQGADGSFPQGGKTDSIRMLHSRSVFMSAAARSLRLLRQSNDIIDEQFKQRAEALVPKLHLSATWLANTRDLETFFTEKKNTNQHFFIVLTIHETGLLTQDQALLQKARSLMSLTLARQTADGTFPEAGGFDFNYQTVSLELLARYTSTITDDAYRAQLTAALQKGIDRTLKNIRADGTVNAEDNTRTMPCREPVPGPGPKGKNIDIVPLRLYYFGYLLGQLDTLAPLADKIETYGQGFDHFEDCGGSKHKEKSKDKSDKKSRKKKWKD